MVAGGWIGNHTGEDSAAESGANFKDLAHIRQLGLRQRRQLPFPCRTAILQAPSGQCSTVLLKEGRHLIGHPEDLSFQDLLGLQFILTGAVPYAEMSDFRLLNSLDHVPQVTVLYGNAGQHFIGRVPAILSAFIDEKKISHLHPSSG